MFYIEIGEVEIYTEFEGNEFIIERMFKGSFINVKQFLLEDINQVYIRCATFCKIG